MVLVLCVSLFLFGGIAFHHLVHVSFVLLVEVFARGVSLLHLWLLVIFSSVVCSGCCEYLQV